MQTRPFKAIDATTLGAARTTLEPLLRQLNGPLQDISQALSRNLTLGDNLAVMLKTVTVTVPTDRHAVGASGEPQFGGNWAAWASGGYADPFFTKDASGRVTVGGLVKCLSSGMAGGAGSTLFTLPPAYVPAVRLAFPTIGNNPAIILAANTDGSIWLEAGTTVSGGWYTLTGIAFDAADRTPIAAPCWPVVLSWDLPGQCIGVVPLSVYVLDPVNKGVPLANVSACSALPSWQQASAAGKPQIKILNQPMLAPGKSYSITYACFAG